MVYFDKPSKKWLGGDVLGDSIITNMTIGKMLVKNLLIG